MTVAIANLDNSHIASAAGIKRTKCENTTHAQHSQTGTVVAATQYVRVVRGATATLLTLSAAITETIATGADRTVTVDLQKSTGLGAFATVLSATIGFTNTSTLFAVSSATISSASLVTGDLLRIVVTVAGAAGNQALGLTVSLTMGEDP